MIAQLLLTHTWLVILFILRMDTLSFHRWQFAIRVATLILILIIPARRRRNRRELLEDVRPRLILGEGTRPHNVVPFVGDSLGDTFHDTLVILFWASNRSPDRKSTR